MAAEMIPLEDAAAIMRHMRRIRAATFVGWQRPIADELAARGLLREVLDSRGSYDHHEITEEGLA